MTDGSPSDGRPDSRRDALAAKRQDLLGVARRHFMTEGYASTRMESIARMASVSTATLYALFPSKAELFACVVEDAAGDFAERINRIGAADGGCREQLTAFALGYSEFMAQPFVRSVFRLVMAERPRFPELAENLLERGRTHVGGALMRMIETQAQQGALKADRPSWAAGQLMGMIEHPLFFAPMLTGDETSAARTPHAIAVDAVETFMARYGAAQG